MTLDQLHALIDRRDLVRRWMRDTHRTQAALAKELGVSPVTVWRWLHGHRTPTRAMAARLEQLSEGAVPVGVWG